MPHSASESRNSSNESEIKMTKKINIKHLFWMLSILWLGSCKTPAITAKSARSNTPDGYVGSTDTLNASNMNWREYFKDPKLIALIDTSLQNNQELNIMMQEIEMGKNEVMVRKGEYLPFLNFRGGAGPDRAGKYTWDGFSEDDLKEHPEKGPKYIGDFMAGAFFSWELDVWHKLRNARKSAALSYMSSIEGRNFMVTNLIAEIATSYYELLALDNMMTIVRQNIELQSNALQIVKLEKEAAKVSQLAVNRFEAQLLNTKNLQFDIAQRMVETENRIHFLTGRFPQPVQRDTTTFALPISERYMAGIPNQLLTRRPDIRQAELRLEAARIDVQVAKANFYPSFSLNAGLGFQAFNPLHVIRPESIIYNLAGDMVAPLINKNAIRATYLNANARQIQTVYEYERSILNAHIEVVNQLSKLDNFSKSFETKQKEADMLAQSVVISNKLFRSARADYLEVLLTQREALDSRLELIEIRLKQLEAKVSLYRSLGGGWN
jgi:NodT family efflux transporter outer membrane factor (OMF) lipoprotein